MHGERTSRRWPFMGSHRRRLCKRVYSLSYHAYHPPLSILSGSTPPPLLRDRDTTVLQLRSLLLCNRTEPQICLGIRPAPRTSPASPGLLYRRTDTLLISAFEDTIPFRATPSSPTSLLRNPPSTNMRPWIADTRSRNGSNIPSRFCSLEYLLRFDLPLLPVLFVHADARKLLFHFAHRQKVV